MRQQTASDLKDAVVVRGWEPELGCTLEQVLRAAISTGCQATALGQAIIEVNRMVCPRNGMLYDLVSLLTVAAVILSSA